MTRLPVAILVIAACAHAKPPVAAKPIQVTIVGPVEFQREVASCYNVTEFPETPATLELDFDTEDVIRRTTVNIRDYNLIVDWARAMAVWEGNVADCLNQLTTTK